MKLLNQFMQGKKWIACQTAVSDFQTILQTVGGCKEKERATHMLEHITIVSDTLSERAFKLKCSGKLKQRAKVIFGTGDYHQAITVTANAGFVRAAENQGVSFAVFLHGSRALTEQKEISAIHLEGDVHPSESLEHTNDASMNTCSPLIDKDVAS
ncbi:unnamed protein product [Owenia fusiformis]|uniref:Uncharacterized protein n=1 Tax=Owenia fusiformis TaxID=6347 RepID=A0A8J1UFJ2_OWEFU|nr:unnamed protein product [Owenia fusiformis]